MRHQPTLKTDAMMAIIKVSEFFPFGRYAMCSYTSGPISAHG